MIHVIKFDNGDVVYRVNKSRRYDSCLQIIRALTSVIKQGNECVMTNKSSHIS